MPKGPKYMQRSAVLEHAPKDLSVLTPRERAELRELAAEQESRSKEALKLFEPMKWQEACFKSRASERVARKGNRSGGSVLGAVETARAALGKDPHHKYPTNRPLTIWLVGYGLSHVGRVFHRLLFTPGAFRIIRDTETGQWRAFRPWEDAGREEQAEDAPPLIPKRFIETISWHNKGNREFSVVRLKNGTEIRAFSSESDMPPMGDPVDFIWIDEDLAKEYWVPELQARLPDRKGRILWTAAPLADNNAMVDMCDRAAKQLGRENPDVEEFRGTFSGNPFIDEDEKRKQFERWDEDEWAKRDQGEFLTGNVLMYPTFSVGKHGVTDQEYNDWDHCKGWTRYMVVDPGHTVCCVTFAAVPPPSVGDVVLVEDCLYLKNCDAAKFGEAVASKVKETGWKFHAFVIDAHGANPHDIGSGKTIKQQYMAELQKHKVRSEVTGSSFIIACDDRKARAMQVRNALRSRENGEGPRLRMLLSRTQPLIDEFPRYKKKKDPNTHLVVDDEANPRAARECHAIATVEYLVAYNPKYHKPLAPAPAENYATRRKKELDTKRARRGRDDDYINIGPRPKRVA